MAAPSVASRRPLSFVDLGSLLYLGAVWGAVFLFMRIAAPQVGPVWAADIRLLIGAVVLVAIAGRRTLPIERRISDRKSTRLNSSHVEKSYAVFCLKKKIRINIY